MEVFEKLPKKMGIYRMVFKKVGENFEPTLGEDIKAGDIVYLRKFVDGILQVDGVFEASVDAYKDANGMYQFDLVKVE